MEVKLLRFEQQRPNGDRATTGTKCYRYEVRIDNFVAHKFDEFDAWWCHVDTKGETARQARKYANDLADDLGVDRPALKTMVLKKTTTEEWVEEDECG